MCQHAASIVHTAVQKLSAFLSKVLNNTLGDSKLLFPYSPLQFFPLALPHQSQMLKPLFLCQLRAQIIQLKYWVFFFLMVDVLSLRDGEIEAQKSFQGAAKKMNLMSKKLVLVVHSLCFRWAAGVSREKPPTLPRSCKEDTHWFTALSRLLTHHYGVESWELGEMAFFFPSSAVGLHCRRWASHF